MSRKKICPGCGTVFRTFKRNQKYCTSMCRKLHYVPLNPPKPKVNSDRLSGQLCWSCANTSGDLCSWFSKKAKPVEGWVAKPTKIKNADYVVESYRIIECPNFCQGRTR